MQNGFGVSIFQTELSGKWSFAQNMTWTRSSSPPLGLGVRKHIRVLCRYFWEQCSLKVGDGRKIKFWRDLWLGHTPLMNRFPAFSRCAFNQHSFLAKLESSWPALHRGRHIHPPPPGGSASSSPPYWGSVRLWYYICHSLSWWHIGVHMRRVGLGFTKELSILSVLSCFFVFFHMNIISLLY